MDRGCNSDLERSCSGAWRKSCGGSACSQCCDLGIGKACLPQHISGVLAKARTRPGLSRSHAGDLEGRRDRARHLRIVGLDNGARGDGLLVAEGYPRL